ncbi:hypothetical protein CHARACLAT_019475 [Characodon lateralis]|uniref:Uncharacterized protein n=1 Tax=Characodon lateralis TaxID=208331 RepID=A0ABU7F4A5_9TELE|nr:hypothetical protein [Characodon lateralis]
MAVMEGAEVEQQKQQSRLKTPWRRIPECLQLHQLHLLPPCVTSGRGCVVSRLYREKAGAPLGDMKQLLVRQIVPVSGLNLDQSCRESISHMSSSVGCGAAGTPAFVRTQ